MNGVGSLDDQHDPSPILLDTVTLFVYNDQLLCLCVFIYSHANRQLVCFFCDDFLCLLFISWVISNTKSINQTKLIGLRAHIVIEHGTNVTLLCYFY